MPAPPTRKIDQSDDGGVRPRGESEGPPAAGRLTDNEHALLCDVGLFNQLFQRCFDVFRRLDSRLVEVGLATGAVAFIPCTTDGAVAAPKRQGHGIAFCEKPIRRTREARHRHLRPLARRWRSVIDDHQRKWTAARRTLKADRQKAICPVGSRRRERLPTLAAWCRLGQSNIGQHRDDRQRK